MEMVTSSSISVNPGLQKLEDDLGALENCEPAPSPSGGKLKFRRHWPVPFSRNPTVHILGAVRRALLISLSVSRLTISASDNGLDVSSSSIISPINSLTRVFETPTPL